MAVNLFNLVKDQFSDNLMGKTAGLLGESNSSTSSAFDSVLSTVIGGVVKSGSDERGAGNLLKVIKDGSYDGGILDNLGDHLGGGAKSDGLMKSGSNLVNLLMGNKTGAILDILARVTGLKRNSSSMFMNILAPIVMGQLGKLVKNKAMDAVGLKNFLGGQKSHIERALPNGMPAALGFADTIKTGGTTERATTTTTAKSQTESKTSGGGGGLLKWLFPLLLLLGLGYFFRNGCSPSANTGGDITNNKKVKALVGAKAKNLKGINKAKDAHAGHNHAAGDHAGHNHADGAGHSHGNTATNAGNAAVVAAKNVAGGAAGVAGAAGDKVKDARNKMKNAGDKMTAKFTVDKDGNLVDENGKILYKSGEYSEKDGYYLDKDGNKIGQIWGKIKDAVGGAAEKTADFFKGTFGGMFSKKQGAKSTYALNDISWEGDSPKITNYSKAEVEGLASALKENKNAKIEVHGGTKDRAQVVADMLVSLGCDKGQVSASQKGEAGSSNVSIVVK